MVPMRRLIAVCALLLAVGIPAWAAAPADLSGAAPTMAAPAAPFLDAKIAPAPLPFLPGAPPPAEKKFSCNGVRYFLCAQSVDGGCLCEGFYCNGVFVCGQMP